MAYNWNVVSVAGSTHTLVLLGDFF
jgi:hypothetical protein